METVAERWAQVLALNVSPSHRALHSQVVRLDAGDDTEDDEADGALVGPREALDTHVGATPCCDGQLARTRWPSRLASVGGLVIESDEGELSVERS